MCWLVFPWLIYVSQVSQGKPYDSIGGQQVICMKYQFSSVQFSCLVASYSLWPMDCSTPHLPVLHHFPEFARTHDHWVSDAMQRSGPLLAPFPPAFKSFSESGSFLISWFFILGGQGIGASASVLPMNTQVWSPLGLTGLIFLLSKGLSRVFISSTTIWKHKFFSTLPSLWYNSHIHTQLLEKNIALTIWIFVGKMMSLLLKSI